MRDAADLADVHPVLAKPGLHLPVSDLFGPGGRGLLVRTALDRPYRARVDACCRPIDALDFEADAVTARPRGRPASTRARIAERRGRTIATVAVARKLLTLVYYAACATGTSAPYP